MTLFDNRQLVPQMLSVVWDKAINEWSTHKRPRFYLTVYLGTLDQTYQLAFNLCYCRQLINEASCYILSVSKSQKLAICSVDDYPKKKKKTHKKIIAIGGSKSNLVHCRNESLSIIRFMTHMSGSLILTILKRVWWII